MILELSNINKSFSGKQILHDVSFTVTSGKAMGFLGRNGAGKTTTIRTLMNVFKADSGQFMIDNKKFDPLNHKIGYLPEERGLYGKEPILEQLIYFGMLRGSSKSETKASAEYWLERFELSYAKDHKLETLSKGNQQKIQIAQALLNDPDIIILDEPFSGLDPVNAQVLKDVIVELIEQEKLVVFSSHQMSYVEEFCDEITLIDQGKVVLFGDLKTIKAEMGNKRLRLNTNKMTNDELKQLLQASIKDIVIDQDDTSLIIQLINNKDKQTFLNEVIQLKIDIDLFTNYEPSLNDIFVKKVGKENV